MKLYVGVGSMKKLGLLAVTLALTFNAPAFAHDTAAMGDMDGDTAPNAMGGQMGWARTW